jgi:hypothetical protein
MEQIADLLSNRMIGFVALHIAGTTPKSRLFKLCYLRLRGIEEWAKNCTSISHEVPHSCFSSSLPDDFAGNKMRFFNEKRAEGWSKMAQLPVHFYTESIALKMAGSGTTEREIRFRKWK